LTRNRSIHAAFGLCAIRAAWLSEADFRRLLPGWTAGRVVMSGLVLEPSSTVEGESQWNTAAALVLDAFFPL
jgi:hypothetical protein